MGWLTYLRPTTLVALIAGLISFYNERVDALCNHDTLVPKPKSPGSEES